MNVRSLAFVVPAWNEEAHLPGTLDAIHVAGRELGRPYELVVADDQSTDGTAATARAHGARVIACRHRQIAATRNSGARASAGELLVFVDADTRVTTPALRGAVAAIEGGATYGGADVSIDGPLPAWSQLMLRALRVLYRRARLAPGAFFFCTRSAFEAAGGFDETLFAAEEIDLARRLGRRGRHAWVAQRVLTSGRKLRAYTGWELLRLTARLALGGRRALRDRSRLDLWYGPRRPDPGGRPPDPSGGG